MTESEKPTTNRAVDLIVREVRQLESTAGVSVPESMVAELAAVLIGDDNLKSTWIGPGGGGGGRNVRLRNLVLNWPKLASAVAEGAISAPSIPGAPWIAPLILLRLWASVHSAMAVTLSEREAAVIWTMWVIRRKLDNTIPDARLLDAVNAELREYGRPPLSRQELDASLAELRRIDCIRPDIDDPARWFLRESVSIHL